MINGVTQGEAIDVLARVMQFTAGRHEIIVNNIANLSTPGFRPLDVSVEEFQANLAEAVDERRASGLAGSMPLQGNEQVIVHEDGMELVPKPVGDNILFHDGNDRSLERTMQDLVENFLAFRTAAELMKRQFDTINLAIRGRF